MGLLNLVSAAARNLFMSVPRRKYLGMLLSAAEMRPAEREAPRIPGVGRAPVVLMSDAVLPMSIDCVKLRLRSCCNAVLCPGAEFLQIHRFDGATPHQPAAQSPVAPLPPGPAGRPVRRFHRSMTKPSPVPTTARPEEDEAPHSPKSRRACKSEKHMERNMRVDRVCSGAQSTGSGHESHRPPSWHRPALPARKHPLPSETGRPGRAIPLRCSSEWFCRAASPCHVHGTAKTPRRPPSTFSQTLMRMGLSVRTSQHVSRVLFL